MPRRARKSRKRCPRWVLAPASSPTRPAPTFEPDRARHGAQHHRRPSRLVAAAWLPTSPPRRACSARDAVMVINHLTTRRSRSCSPEPILQGAATRSRSNATWCCRPRRADRAPATLASATRTAWLALVRAMEADETPAPQGRRGRRTRVHPAPDARRRAARARPATTLPMRWPRWRWPRLSACPIAPGCCTACASVRCRANRPRAFVATGGRPRCVR